MDMQFVGIALGAILTIVGLGLISYGMCVAVTSSSNERKGLYLAVLGILILIAAGRLLKFAQGV